MKAANDSKRLHPIQVVSRRTGISPDAIRVWERRYHAVSPVRSGTNRRLYSDEEIERLLLLRRLTLGGRRIGDVAALKTPQLKKLVAEDEKAAARALHDPRTRRTAPGVEGDQLAACIDAVRDLDHEGLDRALSRAAVEMPPAALIEKLLEPLLHSVGSEWENGSMRIAHEHMATAIVRTFLGSMQNGHTMPGNRPQIVVTTPVGQFHELGALMAAVTASISGWRVAYLGPNLPADEIAAATAKTGSETVALSLVHPADDPDLPAELRKIRRLLGDPTTLLVGGRSAAAYRKTLDSIGAVLTSEMAGFRVELERLRSTRS